ncbi:MAG: hypothetical protein ACO3D0_10820 [Ilumatobacteraceae bacterium]
MPTWTGVDQEVVVVGLDAGERCDSVQDLIGHAVAETVDEKRSGFSELRRTEHDVAEPPRRPGKVFRDSIGTHAGPSLLSRMVDGANLSRRQRRWRTNIDGDPMAEHRVDTAQGCSVDRRSDPEVSYSIGDVNEV